jgi:hypothetical protein
MFLSTALSIWDADFYVKVDDDVHVNIGMPTQDHSLKFGCCGFVLKIF